MKILVTGGCGFIGSTLCHHLVKNPNYEVFNLDAITYAAEPRSLLSIENSPNYTFIKGDIRDAKLVEAVLREFGVNAVMNLAAESHVDRSIVGPQAFLETNILGTFSLLKACEKFVSDGANGTSFRFLHVSTDEVFGDLKIDDDPFDEATKYDPSSPYSASKASSDHLVNAWHRTYKLPTIITNCSNNYGPYQFPEKLIPLMIINAIQDKGLPVYGNGKNIRDWLHVKDHVRGLEQVLLNGKIGETYNIGGNEEHTNLHIVHTICKLLDELSPRTNGSSYQEQIIFVQDRPGHDFRYAINAEKVRKELGWSPAFSFEAGLRDTICWYLENKEWWQPLLNRNKL